ncbi:hypothetical protein BJ165DRAFT_1112490 [Panaeolus papilionaceus]|nr:hypothetical protein BJ165DRAFT_1112490 [Panaeolus papilionaceus]
MITLRASCATSRCAWDSDVHHEVCAKYELEEANILLGIIFVLLSVCVQVSGMANSTGSAIALRHFPNWLNNSMAANEVLQTPPEPVILSTSDTDSGLRICQDKFTLRQSQSDDPLSPEPKAQVLCTGAYIITKGICHTSLDFRASHIGSLSMIPSVYIVLLSALVFIHFALWMFGDESLYQYAKFLLLTL